MRFELRIRMAMMFGTLLAMSGWSLEAMGQEKAADRTEQIGRTAEIAEDHPLRRLIEIATEREKSIRRSIRDYSCRIIKRERIGIAMQEYRFIDAKVRLAQNDGEESKPLAIYLKFLRPSDIAGRSVVFVQGRNDDQLIVRRGGRRFPDIVREIDPTGNLAMKESTFDIRHMGIADMVSEITQHLREDMTADPTGDNTELQLFQDARINGRGCTHVRIRHPERQKGLKFHLVNIYVDDELHLPVRIEAYDWPLSSGSAPRLLGEFTYTDVKINVGLTDSDFHPDRVRTARRDENSQG